LQETWVTVLISFLSGSTTVIGALLAVFLKGDKRSISMGLALAEPLGAIFGIALSWFLPQFTAFLLAFAAGAIVFVSVDELVPLAYEHDGMHHFGIGLVAGITTFMVLSTFF